MITLNSIKHIALKSILLALPLLGVGGGLTSCSDFFDPTPKGIMNASDNLSSNETQMYKGLVGIYNDIQNVGDQAIFLTDTRLNVLETTTKAPVALQAVYNYDDLQDNEYADPTGYYKIIMDCNSYIDGMEKLHKNAGAISVTGETFFKPLISQALRCKVWAYLMLGKIYGEAYWFDAALDKMEDLDDTSVFTYCDMEKLTEKCLNLLNNGIVVDGETVPATLNMDWYRWLDSQNLDKDKYLAWQYYTPHYLLLKAELTSWKCNYESEEAAQEDWKWIRSSLLQFMYKLHKATVSSELDDIEVDGVSYAVPGFSGDLESMGYMYQTNIPLTQSHFNIFFADKDNLGSRYQVISTIGYDYGNDQKNRIVQYFCPTYPGDGFYLKASDYSQNTLYNQYDIRCATQKKEINTLGGYDNVITKYYYTYRTSTRTYEYLLDNVEEIQPNLILFRGHDIHFLLAEAENHLGNWKAAQAILNGGITNTFASRPQDETGFCSFLVRDYGWSADATKEYRESQDPQIDESHAYECVDSLVAYQPTYLWNYVLNKSNSDPTLWSPYYCTWFGSAGGYGDCGIVSTARGDLYDQFTYDSDSKLYELHDQTTDDVIETMTEDQRKEYIDWCLAKEHTKEYVAEGKSYGYMTKIAERYSHAGRGTKAAAATKFADIVAPKYAAEGKDGKVRASIANNYFITWNLK